jgi:hypothetical protein
MESRINEVELSLLAYLHNEVPGCGPDFAGESAPMAQDIGVDMPTFLKARSYLAGWGLVGIGDDATFGSEASTYLTSQGEAYMRELDERAIEGQLLQRGKRLGVAGVKSLGQGVVKIGTALLTELAKSSMRGGH